MAWPQRNLAGRSKVAPGVTLTRGFRQEHLTTWPDKLGSTGNFLGEYGVVYQSGLGESAISALELQRS